MHQSSRRDHRVTHAGGGGGGLVDIVFPATLTWPHRALTFVVAVTMTLAMTFLPTQARAAEPTPPATTATDAPTTAATETPATTPTSQPSVAPTTEVSAPAAPTEPPTTDPRPTAESTPAPAAPEPAPVASSEPSITPTDVVTTTETAPVANSPPAPALAPALAPAASGGNPSANLDQCANDPAPSPSTDGCSSASGWVNGNVNEAKAVYYEGDSLPYRLTFGNLSTTGSHTVTIEWDTTKSGTHALDYLTTYNRTVATADPCAGVTGCSGSGTTFAIPADPQVTGAGVTPVAGNFTMFGGTITAVSAYSYPTGTGFAGDKSAQLTLTFTASVANPVLAWAGHISTRADWGNGNSAVAISGSPYHTRLIALDGAGGNQDRALSAAAVVFPARITIVKDAVPNGSTSFPFTASPSPLTGFSLTDDGTTANTKVFSNILNFTSYSVSEQIPLGWALTGLTCTVQDAGVGLPSTPYSVSSPTVTINLVEGEYITCTFTDTRNASNLTATKTAAPSLTRTWTWGIAKAVNTAEAKVPAGTSATFDYTVTVTHDSGTDSGWVVTGQVVVSNPNLYAVSGVSVSDSLDPNASCVVTGGSSTIAASGSATFNYTCTYSAGPAAASQTNTATVTWTDFGSGSTSTSATATVDWSKATTTLVDESVSVSDSYKGVLGTVSYTDPSPKTFTYSRTEAGTAGTCTSYNNTATFTTNDTGTTGSASQSVSVCVGKDLSVTKTAAGTFDRTYLWQITKNVDQTRINVPNGTDATFDYTVDVTQTGVSDAGYTLSGKITVANPNDWEAVTLTGLTDIVDNGGTCAVDPGTYTVPKSGSVDVGYTCTFAAAPSSYTGTNTATATWDKALAFTPTGTASGAAGFTLAQSGSSNKTVNVTDTLGGVLGSVTATDAAPFASTSFTYSHAFAGIGGTCTAYDNTATITETKQTASKTVTVCVGLDPTVSKTAAGSFDRTYLWDITKGADRTLAKIAAGDTAEFQYTVTVTQTGVSDKGYTLGGTITVSNPNDWQDITLSTLTDVVDNGGLCTVDSSALVVPKGGSLIVGYTCSFASAPSYSGTNTATATWDKALFTTPTGSATGAAPFTLTQKGSTNKTVLVTDSYAGDLGTVTATDTAPYATGTFTYTRSESGVPGTCTTYSNTAGIVETSQTASQSVQLCVAKDLSVTKTAAGTYDRTYLWDIAKNAAQTSVNIAAGGLATFDYTVNVTQTGITDAGWTLSGTITVTNPNDWQDITLSALTDAVDNGGVCVVDGSSLVVPKSGTLTVPYSCTFASAPSAYTGTNSATATWDKAVFTTPTGSAIGTATFALTQAGTTNKTVSVTDSLGGSLGTVTATDGAPFASRAFTYQHSFAGVGGTCTAYDNTATITETGTSASAKVTVCVGLDPTVSKTAAGTFDRTYLWDIAKNADKTSVNIAAGGLATFDYTVDVTQTGITDAGWKLSGTITVTNPNDWQDITLSALTDAVDNGGVCTVDGSSLVVPKSGSLTVAYSCTFAASPASYSGTNTATATWDEAAFTTPTGSAFGTAPFTLTQLGSTNKTVTVTDTLGGTLGAVTATDLPPFASQPFTYSYSFAGVGGACTSYDNTATISETKQSASEKVTVCVGLDLTVTKTAAGTFDRTYLWQIAKDADKTSVNVADGTSAVFTYTVGVTQTGVTDSGWVMAGVITVHNPNSWQDVTLTGLTDAVNVGGSCTVDPGPYVVPASGSLNVAYTCSFASAPLSYSGTNTATATWDPETFATPTGSAAGSAPFTLTQAGSTNKTVTVTDTLGGALGTATATDGPVFATKAFTYGHSFPGVGGTCTAYDNTATITETGQFASKTVTVCVGKDLTVSKTAAGTYDRTYTWSIAKDVDKTSVSIPDGSTATFNYSVTATQTGYTDSGWVLSGTITVTNPNDWEPVTLTSLTDVVTNGGTCSLEPGPYTVPKGSTLDVKYSCLYSSATALSGTNSVTATWDKAAASTPGDTASGSAPFILAQLNSTNPTVHVTDSRGGALGTVTATDSSPFASKTFTYSKDFAGVGGRCTTYDNTATITETGVTASQSVTVCVGQDLTVTKTAAGTFDRTYLWSIGKDVDKTSVSIANGSLATFNYSVAVNQTGYTDSGWTLSGKITINNPNDWEAITLTGLTDVVDNGGVCTVDPGPYSVPKSGSIDVAYSCTFASAPLSYTGSNTASATWDKASASTPSGTASGSAGFTLVQKGSTNQTVHVTDSYKSALGTVAATDTTPFASATFTYSRTEPGVGGTCTSYDNTATITETTQSASKTVQVCVGKDLTVSKTAAGTYDRTYAWTIDKSVDKTTVVAAPGDNVTFNYSVKVTPTGYTDSGWAMSGKITVSNPNDWEAVTLTGLADSVTGGVCSVDPGPYTVPKSGSIEVGYSCSFASEPSSYSLTDTATATWDKATAFTPTGTASGSKAATLTLKGETNKSITVVDDKTDPLNPVTLGTADWFSVEKTFTYSVTKASSGLPGECTSYTNTATIKETSQSDSQIVTVCTPSSKITPTQTTCQMYRDGTAAVQSELMYNVSKGVIGSVAPGVIFYWSTITAPSSDFTVGVVQTNSAAWRLMGNMDVFLWDATCTKVQSVSLVSDSGQPVLHVTGATPGATYFYSVKYDTNSLDGIQVKKGAGGVYPTVTYTFTTTLNGTVVLTSPDSVAVMPKK